MTVEHDTRHDFKTNTLPYLQRLLRAIYALGREVESRGAYVEVVQIPGEGKVGLDDYFANGGTIEGYENMDRVQLRQPSLKVFRSWYTRWRVAKELAA